MLELVVPLFLFEKCNFRISIYMLMCYPGTGYSNDPSHPSRFKDEYISLSGSGSGFGFGFGSGSSDPVGSVSDLCEDCTGIEKTKKDDNVALRYNIFQVLRIMGEGQKYVALVKCSHV
jgi:hypothetical protein